jgi:hypothetical protein
MATDPYRGDTENEEWAAWYALSMQERWEETLKLWQFYLSVGASLDPEPDTQSPFYFEDDTPVPVPVDGKQGARVVRRSGV